MNSNISIAERLYYNQKEASKRYQKNNPDKIKEIRKRYLNKIYSDPIKHQLYLEKRRIKYHLKKNTYTLTDSDTDS